jgi:hypothetical protein
MENYDLEDNYAKLLLEASNVHRGVAGNRGKPMALEEKRKLVEAAKTRVQSSVEKVFTDAVAAPIDPITEHKFILDSAVQGLSAEQKAAVLLVINDPVIRTINVEVLKKILVNPDKSSKLLVLGEEEFAEKCRSARNSQGSIYLGSLPVMFRGNCQDYIHLIYSSVGRNDVILESSNGVRVSVARTMAEYLGVGESLVVEKKNGKLESAVPLANLNGIGTNTILSRPLQVPINVDGSVKPIVENDPTAIVFSYSGLPDPKTNLCKIEAIPLICNGAAASIKCKTVVDAAITTVGTIVSQRSKNVVGNYNIYNPFVVPMDTSKQIDFLVALAVASKGLCTRIYFSTKVSFMDSYKWPEKEEVKKIKVGEFEYRVPYREKTLHDASQPGDSLYVFVNGSLGDQSNAKFLVTSNYLLGKTAKVAVYGSALISVIAWNNQVSKNGWDPYDESWYRGLMLKAMVKGIFSHLYPKGSNITTLFNKQSGTWKHEVLGLPSSWFTIPGPFSRVTDDFSFSSIKDIVSSVTEQDDDSGSAFIFPKTTDELGVTVSALARISAKSVVAIITGDEYHKLDQNLKKCGLYLGINANFSVRCDTESYMVLVKGKEEQMQRKIIVVTPTYDQCDPDDVEDDDYVAIQYEIGVESGKYGGESAVLVDFNSPCPPQFTIAQLVEDSQPQMLVSLEELEPQPQMLLQSKELNKID